MYRLKNGSEEVLIFAGVVLLFLSAMTYANYRFSLASPGGADFVPRWLGTRLFLTEGINPYSQEATDAIQLFKYGRLAAPHQDQLLFVYPLFSVLIFAPFSLTGDYMIARALWMTTQQVALIIMAIIGLRLSDWRPRPLVVAGILTFSILWYHSFRPLINGNPAIISGFFIATGLLAIRTNRDILAGILLTLSSIKPQMVILLIPLVLIWAISTGRRRLIMSLIGSFVVLIGFSILILPDWIGDNLSQIMTYPSYTAPGTPTAIFTEAWTTIGPWLGYGLTLLMITTLLWYWRTAIGQGFDQLLFVAFITLAITNLVGIRTTTANFIAMLPSIIIVIAATSQRFKTWGPWLVWLLLAVLFFGLWILFLTTRSGNSQNPVLFFPLPLFVLISFTILIYRPVPREV